MVDGRLQTSVPGIFAAGDVASFPDVFASLNGEPRRRHVEHWDNAVAQGQVAGANMAGKRVRFQHVPYFWSDLFDHTINVVGSLDGAEIAHAARHHREPQVHVPGAARRLRARRADAEPGGRPARADRADRQAHPDRGPPGASWPTRRSGLADLLPPEARRPIRAVGSHDPP